MTALVSGEVGMLVTTTNAVIPLVKAGKVRVIAICSAKRSPALPDVPTMVDSGFAGFEANTFTSVLAPAKTPEEIIQKLNTEIVRILHMPAMQDRFSSMGCDIAGSTPAEFSAHIKEELDKYAKVVKDAGIPRIK